MPKSKIECYECGSEKLIEIDWKTEMLPHVDMDSEPEYKTLETKYRCLECEEEFWESN